MKLGIPAAIGAVALGSVLAAGPAEAGATQGTGTYAASFVTCWGSQVYLTGSVHYKEFEPEFNFEYNYRLTGTDSVTGAKYRFNATIISTFAGSPDGTTVEETFVRQVRLIGLAGAESLDSTAVLHVTQVDGTITADILRIDALC